MFYSRELSRILQEKNANFQFILKVVSTWWKAMMSCKREIQLKMFISSFIILQKPLTVHWKTSVNGVNFIASLVWTINLLSIILLNRFYSSIVLIFLITTLSLPSTLKKISSLLSSLSLYNHSCNEGKLKYAGENVQVKEQKRDQRQGKSHCILLVRHEYYKFNCSFIPSTSSI